MRRRGIVVAVLAAAFAAAAVPALGNVVAGHYSGTTTQGFEVETSVAHSEHGGYVMRFINATVRVHCSSTGKNLTQSVHYGSAPIGAHGTATFRREGGDLTVHGSVHFHASGATGYVGARTGAGSHFCSGSTRFEVHRFIEH